MLHRTLSFSLVLLIPGFARGGQVSAPARGDVDRDEAITLTDAIDLLGHVFLGSFRPPCEPVADANADGDVDVSDAVRVLLLLFRGAPPLAALNDEERGACASGNQPPCVPERPVYRTYPGFPVELAIGAQDPEDDRLRYEALDLPPGASLDAETGVLRWTPAEEQLGPFYVSCAVTDEAAPPNRVTGLLVFLVLPLDPCNRPRCDPAQGCEPELAPLGEDCCGDPAAARVDEPEAGCPAGKVLYIGRNSAASPSIGRLQNCDPLRLVALGQGGNVVKLHLEARCLRPEAVRLEARLETREAVLLDESGTRSLQDRDHGYAEVRDLAFVAEGFFDEGMEANLTLAATDLDGVRLERRVRVVLTRGVVPDLP